MLAFLQHCPFFTVWSASLTSIPRHSAENKINIFQNLNGIVSNHANTHILHQVHIFPGVDKNNDHSLVE